MVPRLGADGYREAVCAWFAIKLQAMRTQCRTLTLRYSRVVQATSGGSYKAFAARFHVFSVRYLDTVLQNVVVKQCTTDSGGYSMDLMGRRTRIKWSNIAIMQSRVKQSYGQYKPNTFYQHGVL